MRLAIVWLLPVPGGPCTTTPGEPLARLTIRLCSSLLGSGKYTCPPFGKGFVALVLRDSPSHTSPSSIIFRHGIGRASGRHFGGSQAASSSMRFKSASRERVLRG